MHVIDCLGKGNIPMFVKILNQFDVPYVVIHDSDSPKIRRKGKYVNNGMWTINTLIRNEVAKSKKGRILLRCRTLKANFLAKLLPLVRYQMCSRFSRTLRLKNTLA